MGESFPLGRDLGVWCFFALVHVLPATVPPRPGQLERAKRRWVWNQFFVPEEHPGPEPLYVGKLHSDRDVGDGSFKYVLSGEGAGSVFTIDDTTGDIHAVRRLDRETKAQYQLWSQALHRQTRQPLEPQSEFFVKVQDINDNEPKFLDGPYQATVPEMSAIGTSVIQLSAADADDPAYGGSAWVAYSILQGQPYFSVEPGTGVVRVSLPGMDREAREQYQVVVQAKDMEGLEGGLASNTTVTVTLSDVNDSPPRFSQTLYQMSVPESATEGAVVGEVRADDPDEGVNAEMRYYITDGDGQGVFDIHTDPTKRWGVLTVKKVLDFETKHTYTVKVEGANTHLDPRFLSQGAFSDVTTVQVNVEDVDEPPEFHAPFYFTEVPEDAEIGVVLATVSALDPDVTNDSVRYSIERASDPGRFFFIDTTSGSLMTTRPLDREALPWHNITVLAMEMNNPSQVGSVAVAVKVLDVNDNSPRLERGEAFVCENAQAGQMIHMLTAVDQDDPPGGQLFHYSLEPGDSNNPNFTLRDKQDNTAWVLTRRGGFSLEEQSTYHLPVSVRDGEPPAHTATGTLTIRVCRCDEEGTALSCFLEPPARPARLSTSALLTVLSCTLLLLVFLLLTFSQRTCQKDQKRRLLSDAEANIHGSIAHCDEEGGGEEDTQAFDMAAMFRPIMPREPLHHWHRPRPGPECVLALVAQADADIRPPPYDSLRVYAYEGGGSGAGSLSSLQSGASSVTHDYSILGEWGPRFHTLARMYGAPERDPGDAAHRLTTRYCVPLSHKAQR